MSEEKVNRETAESDFDRFAEAWCLDTDTAAMKDEDSDSFEGLKRKLVSAIMGGHLDVDGSGGTVLTYRLRFPQTGGLTELTMHVPSGAALVAFDKLKERQAIGKLNAYMAAMCSTNPAMFVQMDGRDLKIFQAVATIFLAS